MKMKTEFSPSIQHSTFNWWNHGKWLHEKVLFIVRVSSPAAIATNGQHQKKIKSEFFIHMRKWPLVKCAHIFHLHVGVCTDDFLHVMSILRGKITLQSFFNRILINGLEQWGNNDVSMNDKVNLFSQKDHIIPFIPIFMSQHFVQYAKCSINYEMASFFTLSHLQDSLNVDDS